MAAKTKEKAVLKERGFRPINFGKLTMHLDRGKALWTRYR